MNTWERKGAAAARSGRFRDMYSAWNAAKGKPKLTARDKQLGVTFNGKMVEAKEYFFEGWLSVPGKNPKKKKKNSRKSKAKSYLPGKRSKSRGTHKAYRAGRKAARSKSNPAKSLRAKIAKMKPKAWYDTTLSGAKVKVQRKGQSLIIRPATRRKR